MKRRVVAMVDADPEWVSLVDKGAARKTFKVLKRATDSVLVSKDSIDNLAKHFQDAEHPFEACMTELADQYPDVERRKQVCGAVKARVKGDTMEQADVKQSMLQALKQRVGVLRQLFDGIEERRHEDEVEVSNTILGAVFDRQVFEDADQVTAWLSANEIEIDGEVEETAQSYRVACQAPGDVEIQSVPYDTGVVLLVQAEGDTEEAEATVHKQLIQSAPEFPIVTAPDVVDGHVHGVQLLDEHQDGYTYGAGAPIHIHRIIGGVVLDTDGMIQLGGAPYASSHSGSIRSIYADAEQTDHYNTGRQGMKNSDSERRKGLGDGPASHVNFRAGITDVETSPGIFQAFELMQRVLFNTLNNADITEKGAHIADNLTEFSNFILEQIGKFEPATVLSEQKHFTAKADPPPPPQKGENAQESGAPENSGNGGEAKALMTELVVLLREALGKTAENAEQQQQQAQKIDQIAETIQGIAATFEEVDERVSAIEKIAIGRRGADFTETPETSMARKRSKQDGVYDSLFPWGHQDGAADTDY